MLAIVVELSDTCTRLVISGFTARNERDTMETKRASKVTESGRVAIKCKYLPVTNHRGSRIAIQRYEPNASTRDPLRMVISWDYALGIGENYAEAVRQYVEKANWGGLWFTSTCPDGAVAVCSTNWDGLQD